MFIRCDRSLRDATNYVKLLSFSHGVEVVHQHVLVQFLLQMRHSDVQNGLRFRLGFNLIQKPTGSVVSTSLFSLRNMNGAST